MALCFGVGASVAAGAFPMESLLERAEYVYVGAISRSASNLVTIEIREALRGNTNNIPKMFEWQGEWQIPPPTDGTVCLVISQGDDRFGKPKPVMSFGQGSLGQCCYTGWMLNPIKKGDSSEIVEHAFSISQKAPWGSLTVEQVQKLVRETNYKPDIRRKY